MAETINEADTIDMDHPDTWKPEKSTAFQGCTQREAYHGLIDGLDASQWALCYLHINEGITGMPFWVICAPRTLTYLD